MIRRPPRSTLFPYTRSSDLDSLATCSVDALLFPRPNSQGGRIVPLRWGFCQVLCARPPIHISTVVHASEIARLDAASRRESRRRTVWRSSARNRAEFPRAMGLPALRGAVDAHWMRTNDCDPLAPTMVRAVLDPALLRR